jgi:septation ring formation regulator EzrA
MEVQLTTNTVTKAEMEEYVARLMESRLQQAMEEFVERNELRLKELSLIERIVRVEEELKNLREMSEVKFDAMEKRFEALQREMNARFEALQREMNARFEAIEKRFSVVQWMIGILVGIPALVITLKELVTILK